MSMSTTPPQDVVSALVKEQKEIHAQLADINPTSITSKSKLHEAIEKTKECMHPTNVGNTVLSLHFLLLGGLGSSVARTHLQMPENPQRVPVYAYLSVKGMLAELEKQVRSKQQWKDGTQEDALDFQWKVAFFAYVLHTLEIRAKVLGVFGKLGGTMLSNRIDKMIEDRKPFETSLEARSQALSSSEKAELEGTCADLYKLLPDELTERFKEAETVLDKAKVLHQVWLEKLGVPASSNNAQTSFGTNHLRMRHLI